MLGDVVLTGDLGTIGIAIVLALAVAAAIRGITIHIKRDDE